MDSGVIVALVSMVIVVSWIPTRVLLIHAEMGVSIKVIVCICMRNVDEDIIYHHYGFTVIKSKWEIIMMYIYNSISSHLEKRVFFLVGMCNDPCGPGRRCETVTPETRVCTCRSGFGGELS